MFKTFRRKSVVVKYLPSNLAARVRFCVGSRILISILGVLYVLPCVFSDGGPDILLTTDSGLSCVVVWSIVCILPIGL